MLTFAGAPAGAVDVWITSGDRSRLLSQGTDTVFEPSGGAGGVAIHVDPQSEHQTIEGFGAAMSDSSAWVLENHTSTFQRRTVMQRLFSPDDGIGINYVRLPMGASDFTASGHYSYNDLPPGQADRNQINFSIDHDRQYIIPRLQEAQGFNPGLTLMGSPWSAPGWMKTSGSMIGGELDPQWSQSYAIYFKKFIEAYEAEGLPIDAVTLQNEPLHVPGDYPGMYMSPGQQADLIKNNFGPVFDSAGIDTKIIAYDHNWDTTWYPLDVLNDAAAKQYIDGTAFHGYNGTASGQSAVHNAHPDKGIYFTEFSGGVWGPNFDENLVWFTRNLFIGTMRNHAKNVLLWNLALDENGGPHDGGCSGCRGVVTVDSSTGAVTYNEEFYTIAHASKFIRPGAVRIGSDSQDGLFETVAFRNPDNSEVLLSLNPTQQTQTLRLVRSGEHFTYNVPANSIATFVWDGEGADFDNGGFEQGGYEGTGGSLDGWQTFGYPGSAGLDTSTSQGGNHSLRVENVRGAGQAGAFQGMTVEAGEVVVASAAALVDSAASPLGPQSEAQLKLEFYSEFGASYSSAEFLGESVLTLADSASAVDTWLESELMVRAPAGAVEARLALVLSEPSAHGAVTYLDTATLEALPRLEGDYNADGVVDAADFTVWRDNLGATDLIAALADGDGNGIVDAGDYTVWSNAYGAASSGAPSIPEPTAAVLALLGCLRFLPSKR